MTQTTEQKAQALVDAVSAGRQCLFADTRFIDRRVDTDEALCRAIEQHEAFRQEVSDAVEVALVGLEDDGHTKAVAIASLELHQFIIPAPKPDPLVEVLDKMLRRRFLDPLPDVLADEAHWLRAALDAAGFEIREKNDD